MYDNLREIRKSKSISASHMKKLLGLKTEGAYYKKESGIIKFSLDEAKKISEMLGMKIEDIFFGNKVSINDTFHTSA
ncbi:helix-turn-helix transcriptional regulator [Maledivibacter halophilus]|uniref:DNA-binding transcriptional regulator, XRE-family HTH domain n=1 Tax=Maledivibacter halophilus TaxID=36842 RepID=A0A1T5KEM5_9FIRM|nr:helix-turn-helix transcriptional regulator [Maledivibacter halophilus]SKC61808.1 DNA-binding transcriptional regulator, XRE-family HTH domain [Maledivibacter halophilus]